MANKKTNAKREAWQKKEEEKGKKVVISIFCVLIALAVLYLFWTYAMMAA